MKPLEISKEQKEKLLEICKVLFQEYIHIEITKGKHVKLFSEWKDHGSHISYKTKDTASIHWFEFCTIIGHKIFSQKENYYNSEEFKTYSRIMLLQNKTKLKHSIDYLYEQFKQL